MERANKQLDEKTRLRNLLSEISGLMNDNYSTSRVVKKVNITDRLITFDPVENVHKIILSDEKGEINNLTDTKHYYNLCIYMDVERYNSSKLFNILVQTTYTFFSGTTSDKEKFLKKAYTDAHAKFLEGLISGNLNLYEKIRQEL
jgi:hypothetical protein